MSVAASSSRLGALHRKQPPAPPTPAVSTNVIRQGAYNRSIHSSTPCRAAEASIATAAEHSPTMTSRTRAYAQSRRAATFAAGGNLTPVPFPSREGGADELL